jgi:hypothetical protein
MSAKRFISAGVLCGFQFHDVEALTKAIDVVFPNSKRSLCTKHLKDNLTDYLKNKIGINTKDRIHLIDLIFGEQGILNSAQSAHNVCQKIYQCWCAVRLPVGVLFHDVVDGLSIVVCPPICCVEAFPS